MESYIYEDEQYGLRPLSREEVTENYLSWFRDEEVNQYNTHFVYPETIESLYDYVDSLRSCRDRIVLAIFVKAESLHIGNVALQNIDLLNRSAELAFLLGNRNYWGKGVGEFAARKLIYHGRQYLNIRRFHLGCLEENVRMNSLAKKLGFTLEGTARESHFVRGSFHNSNLFGMVCD